MTILSFHGIGKILFLDVMLNNNVNSFATFRIKSAQSIAGWGAKPSGRRAEEIAAKHGLPPLLLEDGFLRSHGTGDRFPPLALVVDELGIYYDCTRPSTIENLLNSDTDLLAGIEQQAKDAHQAILQNRLSKYNHAPPFDPALLRKGDKKRVLIVDQTAGDLSIELGGASAESFHQILRAASTENPDATFYVKTHPEVSSGRKLGHYAELTESDDTVLLREPANPLSLIEHMDHVYVVSSTMGFEALLAGKPVTCFGMPWYAGWGATDDRLSCSRRTKKRSVEELFTAGYFHYPRYLNPETRQRGTIFDLIGWLERQNDVETRLHGDDQKGRLICIGFRRWKQANIKDMLSLSKGGAIFVRDAAAARDIHPTPADHLVWWGTTPPTRIIELANESGAKTLRMEDGFIRSVGLGSDLIAPLSLVLDDKGIYFDPRQMSNLEHILATTDFSEEELSRARHVREFIVDNGITKYNLEPRETPPWATEERKVILVPGQVEDDASIRFGCSDVRTNAGLLKAAREACPDAFIVYKPHPDVMSGNRKGKLALREAAQWADHIEARLSVISCIEASDEVHTMTSMTGFDALLRGKKVTTYGQPFYAGWGLTEDKDSNGAALQRRSRILTLDGLVAGTLLYYPLYWDSELRGYTSCEAVLRRIVETRDALEQSGKLNRMRIGYIRRQLRKARILARAFLSS